MGRSRWRRRQWWRVGWPSGHGWWHSKDRAVPARHRAVGRDTKPFSKAPQSPRRPGRARSRPGDRRGLCAVGGAASEPSQGPGRGDGGLRARFLCVLRGGLQGRPPPPPLPLRWSDRGTPIREILARAPRRSPTGNPGPLSGHSHDRPAIKGVGGVSGQPELFPGNVSGRRGNPGALARVGSGCIEPREMAVSNTFPGGLDTARSTARWTLARLAPTRPGSRPLSGRSHLSMAAKAPGRRQGSREAAGNARNHPVSLCGTEPRARAHARVYLSVTSQPILAFRAHFLGA